MATPATAPNSTTTLSGTFGGVEAPCWCNVPACNHTLEPINKSQVVKQWHGRNSHGQAKGGGQ